MCPRDNTLRDHCIFKKTYFNLRQNEKFYTYIAHWVCVRKLRFSAFQCIPSELSKCKTFHFIVNRNSCFFENAVVSKWVVPGTHSFFFIIFIIKNWFWTKKYSSKFSQKSIVKKVQIGSNIIFLMGMKIIHICNFLTINFYEKLQEYFYVRNQFLIIKK